MLVQCPNQHVVEVTAEQFGERIICPACQVLMFISPPRGNKGAGIKYEVRCPSGHALRVKMNYLYQSVPCPKCQQLINIEPSRLSYYTRENTHRVSSLNEEVPLVLAEEVEKEESVEERRAARELARDEKQQRRLRPGLQATYEALDFMYSNWWLGQLGTLIGYYRCLRVPVETGARLWIQLAFWPIIVAFLLGLTTIPIAYQAEQGNDSAKAIVICLVLCCVVMMIGSPFWFILFLAKLAGFLGRKKLREQILHLMPWRIWGFLFIINAIIGFVSLALMSGATDGENARVFVIIFIITFCIFIGLAIAYGFTMHSRIADVRDAIDKYLYRS